MKNVTFVTAEDKQQLKQYYYSVIHLCNRKGLNLNFAEVMGLLRTSEGTEIEYSWGRENLQNQERCQFSD